MTGKPHPIAIVTDSTADIPVEITETLNISVIPAVLTLDGETYRDGLEISRADFYRRMPALQTPPTTAVPSTIVFEETYQRLLDSGIERILSIHLSSKLSAMFNTALQASSGFGEQVKVYDSRQLTLGTGFQVIEAAQAVMKGLDFDQVVETTRRIREKTEVIALINKLEYMHRSGRVTWLQASMIDFLEIKQLVEIKDGLVHALHRTRTYSKAFEQLVSIAHTWSNIKRLAVLHSGAPERAKELAERVVDLCPDPLMIVDVTTVIGVHVGPGCVGFAALTQD